VRKKAIIRFYVALFAALLLSFNVFAAAQAQAQPPAPKLKPEEVKKILQEIAGDYDFDLQGQPMTVTFFEKDGALYGAPPGETPEAIQPSADSPFKFTVAPNGNFMELEFFRNEKKVIDKCVIKTQGMELAGAKRIK
jgi:hypothetical protein